MTGNPAAPRTEAAGTAPVPYDRGIDPAPYDIPRPASAAEGRPPSPLGTPFGRKPDVSGPSRNTRARDRKARATRPTERHAGVPPPNGFSFCRSARALDHIGVAEPVKPAAHGPKGPGRRV